MHANITRLKVNNKVTESLGLTSASLLGLSLGWKQMKPALFSAMSMYSWRDHVAFISIAIGDFFQNFTFCTYYDIRPTRLVYPL